MRAIFALARLLTILLAAGLVAPQALAQPSRPLSGYGIVVLHGKGGTPTTGIEGLTEALKAAGALVEAPELPRRSHACGSGPDRSSAAATIAR